MRAEPVPPPLSALPPRCDADATFWARMNSPSPADDLPSMSAVPPPPLIAPLELLVATPAGKPLLHFHYAPDQSDGTAAPPRPLPSVSTLCAASVAFQNATAHRARLIRTASGVAMTMVASSLHIAVCSSDPVTSPAFLRSLARIAVAAIYARLSSAFASYLHKSPNADAAHLLLPADHLARAALLDAITHPLPHALQTPVPLPCPTRPSSRAAVSGLLRQGLLRWRGDVTHALIFTASPPFPRRVVATAAPANSELSPMDVMLLMASVPLRPTETIETPERLYLQAGGFAVASGLVVRHVELRLDPDDYQNFRTAVGGSQWRPEWNSSGGDSVWMLAVTRRGPEGEKAGRAFLDFVEAALDRASATKDIMVSMERPWTLADMSLDLAPPLARAVRAVLLVEKRRVIGTLGSFEHEIGVAVLQSLEQWDRDDMSMLSPLRMRGKRSLVSRSPDSGMFVVLWDRKFAVCFDDIVAAEEALVIVEKYFVPWLKRFRWSLVPEHDRATVPPQTPLAGMLSPFLS